MEKEIIRISVRNLVEFILRSGDLDSGSYGESSRLAADMARAYCDGMQTTEESPDGWGADSVIAMAKHWPGAGAVEAGREAHFPCGKYAVYPGGNFEDLLGREGAGRGR